jgi:choice-of-anchor A domain-containing protein/LPXTG-motif cell wall-anchored protein
MSSPGISTRRVVGVAAVASVVGALLVTVGLGVAAAPAAAATGECPPGYLPGPHNPDDNLFTDDNVAVFAGGDFLADAASAESEGLMVVMGDATFDKDPGGRFNVGWVGVGSQVAPTPGSVMLAVGGGLTVGANTVLDVGSGARDADTGDLLGGGVRVGGAATPGFPAPQYEVNNGTFQSSMGADAVSQWSTFAGDLAANSTAWTAAADTGTVDVTATRLTFTSTSPALSQFFTVNAADLDGRIEVAFFDVPDGASVVINVVGAPADLTFSPNYFEEDGARADVISPDSTLFGEVAQRTMWNFADAANVTFGGSSQFLGSVLAPTGSFDITASMNGRVYAGADIHLHGVGNELHNYPWSGDEYRCIPIPDPGPDATGSVEITKVLDSTGVVDPDREFYGWMQCTGEGVDGDFYAEGSIHAGETITVDGLPVGSQCEIFEDPTRARLGQSAVPAEFMWADPVWTINGEVVDEPIFTVVAPDDPVQVAVSLANTLLGRFAVTKQVEGPAGGYLGDRTFEIAYSCDADAFDDEGAPSGEGSGAGTFELAAGETATSAWYPVGTTCEISEATPEALPGDFAPDSGYAWQAPTITPGTITIGDDDASPVAVTVTNAFVGPTPQTGSFSIDKVVQNPGRLAFTDSFSGTWTCTIGESRMSGTWTVASTGAPVVVDGIPLGSACAVTENTPTTQPTGGTWGTPVISPASFTVADSQTVVAVTVTNTANGTLPSTGLSTSWPLALGGGLLAVGGVLLLRRRARTSQ